jgi:hypothetical protein
MHNLWSRLTGDACLVTICCNPASNPHQGKAASLPLVSEMLVHSFGVARTFSPGPSPTTRLQTIGLGDKQGGSVYPMGNQACDSLEFAEVTIHNANPTIIMDGYKLYRHPALCSVSQAASVLAVSWFILTIIALDQTKTSCKSNHSPCPLRAKKWIKPSIPRRSLNCLKGIERFSRASPTCRRKRPCGR